MRNDPFSPASTATSFRAQLLASPRFGMALVASLMLGGMFGHGQTAQAQTDQIQSGQGYRNLSQSGHTQPDQTQTLDYAGVSINDVGPGAQVSVPAVLDSGTADGQAMAQVIGGSAIQPVQSELTGSYLRAEVLPQDLTGDTIDGDFTGGYHIGQTPIDRSARYYGSQVTGGDLTGGETTDDQFNSDRGKLPMVAKRLGVFDRNHNDPRHLVIKPYIEASHNLDSFLAPTASEVTYTDLVAGVEVTINGRNNQGVISARVDERIGYGTVHNSTGVTGLASLSTAILPNTLRIDYGGYANETYVTNNGATLANTPATVGQRQQVYAGYVGPTLSTHLGDIGVTGHYRVGYTSIGENGYDVNNTFRNGIDVFGHSVTQQGAGNAWQVRFIMPASYTMESLPRPKDPKVQLRQIDSRRFAVIRFSGMAGEASLQRQTALLTQFIAARKLTAVSAPSYAFYNPPWTLPFLRRNEVMIEVSR